MPARPSIRSAVAARLAGLAALAALAATGPAWGAMVVPAPGGIAVVDRAGVADDLLIGFPAPETVRVRSEGAPLVVAGDLAGGTGVVRCERLDARTVLCRPRDPLAGMRLEVRTGAGDDRVRFTRPSAAPGGILAPRVAGGPGADRITADGLIMGGPGDDILRAVPAGGPVALLGAPATTCSSAAGPAMSCWAGPATTGSPTHRAATGSGAAREPTRPSWDGRCA